MYNRVVFISGPYRANTLEKIAANITAAENEAIWWVSNGFAVICPHKNTGDFEKILSEDKALLPANEELIRRSDIMLMLSGWAMSKGSEREYACAVKSGKVILAQRSGRQHMYNVISPQHLSRDVIVAKGKFYDPCGHTEISWKVLKYERKRRGPK